ncbi:MAG: four helix bundle protein [Candidatus Magasanikbacteria bacterium]
MDNQINNKEIPIITKTIQLYKMYYKYLELFPKKDKYAMGAVCERYIIEILEILLRAGYVPKPEKPLLIKTASNKFDMLKIFIRLLRELDIIDQKKYLALQTVIQEIGKMFGGWIKSLSPAK